MKIQMLITAMTISAAMWGAPAQAQVDPGQFVAPPEGTVTSFHRKSEGSYGAYDGPVTWTLVARDWNGRAVISQTSDKFGGQLLDPRTNGVVAWLNAKGQPTFSFNPDVAYQWPLAVGKSWTSVHEMTQYQPPSVSSLTLNFKVEAFEDVTVPAGTFKAFKVVSRSSFGEVEQWWVSPSQGIATVKRISDRSPTHPLGAGHLEAVLVSRTTSPR